ncbi:MAG: DUF1320 domain-containing protein [Sneathiella sp.]|nr:DUF1320 domain-containing protein [Sneathiella sp.]
MAYLTEQELNDSFGQIAIAQLADRDGDNDAVKMSNAISTAISFADAEVDAYLEGVYQLPIASIPQLVSRIAADVAHYYLASMIPTDNVKDRYNNAISLLTRLHDQEIHLNIPKVVVV